MNKGWFQHVRPWLKRLAIVMLTGMVFLLGWNFSHIFAQDDAQRSEPGALNLAEAVAQTPADQPELIGMGALPNHWFSVIGANFIPSASNMAYVYGNAGCLTATGAGDWRASVNLPDGAIIKYIYFNYQNTATSGMSNAFLTRYRNDGVINDLTYVTSRAGSVTGAGRFLDLSPEMNEVVDNASYGYSFVWSGSTTQKLCNMRVAYFPPATFGVVLPLINK